MQEMASGTVAAVRVDGADRMLRLACARFVVLAGLILAPGAAPGQEADTILPRPVTDWLSARGLAPDSASVIDEAGGAESHVWIVKPHDHQEPYWMVRRGPDEDLRRLGTIPSHWDGLTVELVLPREIYVRKRGSYGVTLIHRYSLGDDGSIDDEEIPVPRPSAIAIVEDSVYAAWSVRDEAQLAVAVSLRDGGAAGFRFGVPEPVEEIGPREGAVAFFTSERAIVRHDDGGWGGYRRDRRSYDPPGVRMLHPSLPQFRVAEEGLEVGLEELRLGDTLSIPLDYPDVERLRRARPDHLARVPDEAITIDVDVGPVTDDGRRVWFGLTFYDGEGLSGVGGLGWLDPSTREAQLIHPPPMADFSVAAITAHDGGLLLGLATIPEGAVIGRGLGRYDPASGSFERILERGYIRGIVAHEERVFAVASEGLIEIAPEQGLLRRWRLFPTRSLREAPHVVPERGPW